MRSAIWAPFVQVLIPLDDDDDDGAAMTMTAPR
jgi:hypothetical protein